MSGEHELDEIALGAALILVSGVMGRMGWRTVRAAAERIAVRQLLGELGASQRVWYGALTGRRPAPWLDTFQDGRRARRALPAGEADR